MPVQNLPLRIGRRSLCVRVYLDFALDSEFEINLQHIQSQAFFPLCQTLYVDNSLGSTALTITISSSGQVIVAAAGTQGYYAAVCPNPIAMTFASSGVQIATVLLLDAMVTGAVWSAAPASVVITPVTSSTVSAPGPVAVGVVAVELLAANALRKRMVLQNTGLYPLWILFGVGVPSQTNYHLGLPADGALDDGSSRPWIDELWLGAVQAISSGAGFCNAFENT